MDTLPTTYMIAVESLDVKFKFTFKYLEGDNLVEKEY